mmetsp:Transcript_127441/g.354785  ORF Transcript_127441/g.354785 Transcript_127441/m.354785 type:complete len:212 (-) Transcript_127441:29-664(-)
MGIAFITRDCGVAILLVLFNLAIFLLGACACLNLRSVLVWLLQGARLGAAPRPAVQDLRVHEGLKVVEVGALVEANIPLRVHLPVPHGPDHIGVAPLARHCGVAILEHGRQLHLRANDELAVDQGARAARQQRQHQRAKHQRAHDLCPVEPTRAGGLYDRVVFRGDAFLAFVARDLGREQRAQFAPWRRGDKLVQLTAGHCLWSPRGALLF